MTNENSGQTTDPVERVVFDCLEKWEKEGLEAVHRACRENPEIADRLRARFRGLEAAGLLPGQDEDAPFPDTLGDFRLLSRLGGGGMGVVYLAEQRSLARLVALKLIRPEQHYFPGSRARFRREVEAVARLGHPGIVPIFTVGEEQGIPFFAMERVEGCTLAEALSELAPAKPQELSGRDLGEAIARRSGGAPPEACRAFDGSWSAASVRLALDLAAALQHAHERGVVHRDVKPSNVMVTAGGRVMLVDFGLARAEGSARLTASSSTIGSMAYMPPEQARGQNRDAGPTTDVYALGVTLYELFTLRPAYLGTNIEETRSLVLEAKPPSVRSLNPAVPRDAETVCMKAMDPDPERRYQSAADFARDLSNVLELRPIAARRPGPGLRAVRFVQRKPALAAALALAFVLLVCVPTVFALYEKGKREQADRNEYGATILAASASLHVNEVREAKRLLASCGERLRGWEWRHLDAACNGSVEVLADQGDKIVALAASPGGDTIVSAGYGGAVLLRDGRSGRILRRLPVPEVAQSAVVSCAAFDPAGTRIVAGLNEGTVLEWDVESGALAPRARTHVRGGLVAKMCGVSGIVFQRDGKSFWTASGSKEVRHWDAGTERSRVVGTPERRVFSLAQNPSGTMLASGTESGAIRLHDAQSKETIRTVRAHEATVRCLAFSPDGERIASGSDDETVRVFSAATGESELVLRGHQGSVYAVAFCPDGKRVVSAGGDRTVRLWSLQAKASLAVLQGHDEAVFSLLFVPGSEDVLSGSADGTLRRWDLARAEVLVPGDDGYGWITSIAVAPDGSTLATGHLGFQTSLRDPESGAVRNELSFERRALYGVAFSPDGKRLAAGGYLEGKVAMWESDSGRRIPEFAPTTGTVNALTFSADGARVIGACEDGALRVWNAADGSLLRTLSGHAGAVTCVAASRDGRYLVSGSKDRTLRLWDSASGNPVLTLAGHPGHVHSVAFDPGDRLIASGAADRTVRLWEVGSGQCLADLRGHDHLVSAVAFSPDGRRLVSASWDHTLRVWDPDAMRLLCILRGHAEQVNAIAFTPDGTRIFSGSQDGTLRVWDSRPGSRGAGDSASRARPAVRGKGK